MSIFVQLNQVELKVQRQMTYLTFSFVLLRVPWIVKAFQTASDSKQVFLMRRFWNGCGFSDRCFVVFLDCIVADSGGSRFPVAGIFGVYSLLLQFPGEIKRIGNVISLRERERERCVCVYVHVCVCVCLALFLCEHVEASNETNSMNFAF